MWLSIWFYLSLGDIPALCDQQETRLHYNSAPENSSDIVFVKTDNSSDAVETQQATCHIATEQIVATAKASVTRALTGVCTSKDLEQKYQEFKTQINHKMDGLERILNQIFQTLEKIYINGCGTVTTKNQKSYSTSFKAIEILGPRYKEIISQNNTIHNDVNGDKVFSYFWKIEDVRSKLEQGNQLSGIRSPSFDINQGYRMYLQLYPAQSRSIYVQVGLTVGDADDELDWPFRLRHRVTLLDLATNPEDIQSRIWDPAVLCESTNWQRPNRTKESELCVGFGFSQETLFSRSYVFNDCVIIKLDVFDASVQSIN